MASVESVTDAARAGAAPAGAPAVGGDAPPAWRVSPDEAPGAVAG